MMRIKICGITRLEDALCAVEYGADAIGFILYKKSKRYIEPQKIREICDALPPFIERVGVFVENTPEEIDAICQEAHLSLAQLHSEEINAESVKSKYLQVIRAQNAEDIQKLDPQKYYLVDAFVKEYGGEGERVALEWFEGVDCSKITLAGGISRENIDTIKPFGFYGVDISSSVEIEKGIKDCKKIKEFLEYAKTL